MFARYTGSPAGSQYRFTQLTIWLKYNKIHYDELTKIFSLNNSVILVSVHILVKACSAMPQARPRERVRSPKGTKTRLLAHSYPAKHLKKRYFSLYGSQFLS